MLHRSIPPADMSSPRRARSLRLPQQVSPRSREPHEAAARQVPPPRIEHVTLAEALFSTPKRPLQPLYSPPGLLKDRRPPPPLRPRRNHALPPAAKQRRPEGAYCLRQKSESRLVGDCHGRGEDDVRSRAEVHVTHARRQRHGG